MHKRVLFHACSLLWFLPLAGTAQNIAGFWLGVTYPADPNQAVYNYTMSLTQRPDNTLSGTAQTANPDVPFGGVAYISGQVASSKVRFSESDKNGSTAVKDICFWRGTLTYNPTEESLIGTYESIVNNTTCSDASGGTVELYRIVLKSRTKYCQGSLANLVVTGKNIRWYASAAKTKLLATGNTYSPTLTQTTTFYITQTLYKNESPTVPITIDVVTPTLKATSTNAGCGQANGSIAIEASGSAGWQYSLNGGAFQATPVFAGLSPGSYKVAAKDSAGCQAEQSVTLAADAGPAISDLKLTPPRCQTANGTVNIVATGGTTPLTYSLDTTPFGSNPVFENLPGGSFTAHVRDATGCEVSKAFRLSPAKPMGVLRVETTATTCGQPNGQATVFVAGDTKDTQYRINNQAYQTANTFNGLKAATYTFTAQDSAGCTASQSVSVAASTGPDLADVRITPEGCGQKNGAVSVSVGNASTQTAYSLDGKAFQPSSAFANLSAGPYTLTLRDAANCVVTRAIVIPLDCANLVQLPTAFSPNGDNVNDALTAHFPFASLSVVRLTVYNRWGVVLYNRSNFTLTSGEPFWDGKLGGQVVAAGTYSCQIEFQFPNGTLYTYRTSVEVLN